MIIENVEALKSWLAKLLEPMWVLNGNDIKLSIRAMLLVSQCRLELGLQIMARVSEQPLGLAAFCG